MNYYMYRLFAVNFCSSSCCCLYIIQMGIVKQTVFPNVTGKVWIICNIWDVFSIYLCYQNDQTRVLYVDVNVREACYLQNLVQTQCILSWNYRFSSCVLCNVGGTKSALLPCIGFSKSILSNHRELAPFHVQVQNFKTIKSGNIENA
jgi:hypothetical protein